MNPHFDCVANPESLSNRILFTAYRKGCLGESTLLDTYFTNWGQLVKEKSGVENVWI